MLWTKTLLTLFSAFAIANAYISNIAVDVPNGQIYITEGNVLYEVDNVHLQQNMVHFTSGAADFGPLFITRRSNNKRVVFSFENMDTTNELVYYPLPLKNQRTLIRSDSLSIEKGLSLGSTFDNTDKIAILSVSRNLTLIDLTSLTVMDTFTYWVGSRIFGRNVVYNHQTNRVTIFRSRVPIRGNYGLDVNEYSIASGTFEEVQSTYNCLCDEGHNLTASPFYKAIVSDCEIDYSTTPAKIWCSVPEQKKFFAFMAANLSDFQVIYSSASFDSIAWDFVNRLAYGIKSNTAGFSVSKININNGQVVQTYTNTVTNIDSSVYKLDPNEPQLYLAVDGQSKILSLSTSNFSTLKSITLTPPSP